MDIQLIADVLRRRGYDVQEIIGVPENAGEYEFLIDGQVISLEAARLLLEKDQDHPLPKLDETAA